MTEITPELLRDPVRAGQLIRDLEPLAVLRPETVFEFCAIATFENPLLIPAYILGAKTALRRGDTERLTQFLMLGRNAGHEHLIKKGKLDEGRAFFRELAQVFPDPFLAYVLLFDRIAEQSAAHREMRLPASTGRRRLLVALTVWGTRHTELFTSYGIPSMLSPNNLPAVAKLRELHFDIFTTATDEQAIRNAPSFQKLAALANVRFVTLPDEILNSTEYRRAPDLRYWIFGGFHHVAIEHARAIGADIMPSMPDVAFTDGALLTYTRAVDEGYHTVLSFSIRTQAEGVRPVLDTLRDETMQSLTLPCRLAAELSVLNVHHAYKCYFLTKDNLKVPLPPPVLMFPHEHGFYARCLHMHPMILSAAAISRDVRFDYFTIDSDAVANFFPAAEDLKHVKVIQDSDEGGFIEISPTFDDTPVRPTGQGRFELDTLSPDAFLPHHYWTFQHRINFHCDATIEAFGTYERERDGSLHRVMVPQSTWSEFRDDQVAAWLHAERERVLTAKAAESATTGAVPPVRP
jgi:hypothetical protein